MFVTKTQIEYEKVTDRHTDLQRIAQQRLTELLDGIRHWYNGYSWDGRTFVYNPFSTLLFFDKRQFDNYWFRTGTPTFLIETLKKRNLLNPVLEPVTVSSKVFESFDPARISEISLLFQTGYLTVKQKNFSTFFRIVIEHPIITFTTFAALKMILL